MKRFIAVALVFLGAPVSADTFTGDYVGCVTENALDEIQTAIINQDRKQFDALIGVVCAPLKNNEFSVIERGLLRSKVRVYVGENSVVMWTVSEAVKTAK